MSTFINESAFSEGAPVDLLNIKSEWEFIAAKDYIF